MSSFYLEPSPSHPYWTLCPPKALPWRALPKACFLSSPFSFSLNSSPWIILPLYKISFQFNFPSETNILKDGFTLMWPLHSFPFILCLSFIRLSPRHSLKAFTKIMYYLIWACCVYVSHSVVSNSLWPQGLGPTRLLCPWDSPGMNTGAGCHFLLQGIFLIQRSNPGLLHCRKICISNPHLNYQRLKHLPARRETRVQSLGREDPLEKEMATHSSILAWKIPWTEEPGRLQSTGVTKSWTQLSDFTHSLNLEAIIDTALNLSALLSLLSSGL